MPVPHRSTQNAAPNRFRTRSLDQRCMLVPDSVGPKGAACLSRMVPWPERRCMPVPNGPEWRLSRKALHACPEWRSRMALHACPEWDVPNGVFGWRFSKGRGMPVPDRGVPDRGPGSWGSISCRNHRCSENVARKMNNPGESRGCPCISSSSWMPSSPVTRRLFPRTGTRLS
jgi:hypothetical protein